MIPDNQSPSDIQVLDIQYQHVGDTRVYNGKVAIIPTDYRWLLDIDLHTLHKEYPPEWYKFAAPISHYIDVEIGDTLEELVSPLNPHEFYILVTDNLIQQLTPRQVFRLWEVVSNEDVELPSDVERPALSSKLWGVLAQLRQEYFESQIGAALLPYLEGDVDSIPWGTDRTVTELWTGWVEKGIAPSSLRMNINMWAPLSEMYQIVIDKDDTTCIENLIIHVPNLALYMNEDISVGGVGLKKLEEMAVEAMTEYHAGLTQPDTL